MRAFGLGELFLPWFLRLGPWGASAAISDLAVGHGTCTSHVHVPQLIKYAEFEVYLILLEPLSSTRSTPDQGPVWLYSRYRRDAEA